MLTNYPEKLALVQADLANFHTARDAYLPLQAVCIALREEIDKHGKAALAAEADAARLRAENKGLLRSFTGQLSKSFRDLKAQERAAYALAEDWRELATELQTSLAEAEEVASLAWGNVVGAQDALRKRYSAALIEVGLSELPPALRLGFQLLKDCRNKEGRFAAWHTLHPTAAAAAWSELAPALETACAAVTALPDDAICVGLQPLDADGVPSFSPSQLQKRRAVRAQAERVSAGLAA